MSSQLNAFYLIVITFSANKTFFWTLIQTLPALLTPLRKRNRSSLVDILNMHFILMRTSRKGEEKHSTQRALFLASRFLQCSHIASVRSSDWALHLRNPPKTAPEMIDEDLLLSWGLKCPPVEVPRKKKLCQDLWFFVLYAEMHKAIIEF